MHHRVIKQRLAEKGMEDSHKLVKTNDCDDDLNGLDNLTLNLARGFFDTKYAPRNCLGKLNLLLIGETCLKTSLKVDVLSDWVVKF